jgi:hypothetical protein
MPAPINSPRTRVIETATGYVSQMCCDGLTWFDLPDPVLLSRYANIADEDRLADQKYYATRMAMAAQETPSHGRVVWTSDGK